MRDRRWLPRDQFPYKTMKSSLQLPSFITQLRVHENYAYFCMFSNDKSSNKITFKLNFIGDILMLKLTYVLKILGQIKFYKIQLLEQTFNLAKVLGHLIYLRLSYQNKKARSTYLSNRKLATQICLPSWTRRKSYVDLLVGSM